MENEGLTDKVEDSTPTEPTEQVKAPVEEKKDQKKDKKKLREKVTFEPLPETS